MTVRLCPLTGLNRYIFISSSILLNKFKSIRTFSYINFTTIQLKQLLLNFKSKRYHKNLIKKKKCYVNISHIYYY